jgi:hypothetical protein
VRRRGHALNGRLSVRCFGLSAASAVNRQQQHHDCGDSAKRDDLAVGATIRADQ